MEKKFIYIRRKENITRIPEKIYSDSKRKIGAVLTKGGQVDTGITLEEQKKYLPEIIGVSANDASFFKKVKEYYAEMSFNIPYEGKKLNISTDNGTPVNLMDFLKYKFAIVNPEVAASRAESSSNTTKFYIYDPVVEKRRKQEKFSKGKDAYAAFIVDMKNKEKAVMLASIFKVDTKLPMEDIEMELDKVAKEQPAAYSNASADKNLPSRFFINECLTYGVLKRVGTAILNGDENIGSDMESAMVYIDDKQNSELRVELQAKLDQFKHAQ